MSSSLLSSLQSSVNDTAHIPCDKGIDPQPTLRGVQQKAKCSCATCVCIATSLSDAFAGSKPVAGSNVNIPFGWNLVIDENPPPLGRLVIEGNVTVSGRRDISITADAIIVRNNGSLLAGSAAAPHPRKLELLLTGNRSSSNIVIR
jgi:hypothetical protein